MEYKNILELEKLFNIKLPETYVKAVLSCPIEFDEEWGPILFHSLEELKKFNEYVAKHEFLTAKGKYFGIFEESGCWFLIDLTVDNSKVMYFDPGTNTFEDLLGHDSVDDFIEHFYSDRKECEELDQLQELSDNEVKEKFYDKNIIATYINFAESLDEVYEDLDDDTFEKVILASLKDVGIEVDDIKKLYESAGYFMEISEDDIFSQPGYELQYSDFAKHL